MNLDINKWKDFYLSDVFTRIEPGKVSQAYQLEEGTDIPYLGAKKDDNGVMAWCAANNELKSDGNCVVLICDGQGSVGLANYMESDFLGTVNLMLCYNDSHLNQYTGLFLATIISQERPKYSFGRKWKTHINDMLIKLPQTEIGEPDWKFMEQYIKTLNYKPLTTANRGRCKSYTLGIEKWKECKISDLFNVHTGGDLILSEIDEGDYPVASNSSSNNNIAFYSSFIPNRKLFNHTCSISIADRGAFKAFVQPKDFYIGTRAKGLECKDKNISTASLLFIVTVINQQSFRFSYGYNCCAHLNDMIIKLPINNDGSINYNFMENYIKSLPYGDRI